MNIKKLSSFRIVPHLLKAADAIGAYVELTEQGLMISRPNTLNGELRQLLISKARAVPRDIIFEEAWGCGLEGRGGLHFKNL